MGEKTNCFLTRPHRKHTKHKTHKINANPSPLLILFSLHQFHNIYHHHHLYPTYHPAFNNCTWPSVSFLPSILHPGFHSSRTLPFPTTSSKMVDCGEPYSVSNGSALPWILEHYLAYPGSYEIPLRTMYTLNSAPTSLLAQPSSTSVYQESAFAREKVNAPSSPAGSTCSQSENHFPFVYDTAAQFRAQLVSQIPRLPSQHCSLPPSFVTSFLRRCFAHQLEEVDFPQALTALDYLKDLETRRRKEVAAALARLGIDRADMSQKQEMGQRYPGVLRWIESLEAKERRVEALYTQVYVGLRRWVSICVV
jgi:hypothetical protein